MAIRDGAPRGFALQRTGETSRTVAVKRRQLNAKLLLALVGATTVLGLGLHFLHGAQVNRSADVLLDQAKRAEAADDPGKALNYLERYLAYRPTDSAALVKLGGLLEKRAEGEPGLAQAIRVYERALRADPRLDEIRQKVIDLYLSPGFRSPKHAEAKPHLDLLNESHPNDAQVLDQLAQCEEGLSRFDDAEKSYRKAIDIDPSRVDTYVRLAELLRLRLNDEAQADALMSVDTDEKTGLMAKNPESARAFLARALYRRRHPKRGTVPDKDPIAADVAQALKLDPDDVDVLKESAILERDRGQYDAAREHLTRALELKPDLPDLYKHLADLEIRDKKPEAAVTWLKQGIEQLPYDTDLRYSLAIMLAEADRLDEARDVIKDLSNKGMVAELINYLNARVLMREKKWDKAAELLEKAQLYLAARIDARDLNKLVLMMLGDCYRNLGLPDKRTDAYRRAVAIDLEPDPYRAAARLQLAESLRAAGKIDEAFQEYLLLLPEAPELRIPVAQLVTLQNLRVPPEQQRWAIVEQLLGEVEREQPESMAAPILRAEMLYARNQPEQARTLLEKTRDAYRGRSEPWLALAALAEKQKQNALAVLNAADKALGPRLDLRIARARYWARNRGPAAPEALVQLERDASSMAPQEQAPLWREIAVAYAQIGAPDRAQLLWKQLAERAPADLGAQQTLFDMSIQTKDEAAAKQALERIRSAEGDTGINWRYCEAVLLTLQARKLPLDQRRPLLDQARDHLLAVAQDRPDWSRATVALGDLAAARGDEVEALRNYQRAIDEQNDRSPGALIAAAQLLYSQRRYDQADRMIGFLRDLKYPISGELQRLVAEIAFQNRDWQRALEQAQQVVRDDSDNYRDLIWLGRLRWRAGQDAEPVLRRAIEKQRDAVEAWVTLIVYLSQTDRREQAIEVLQEAEQAIPPEKAPLALAEGHEAVGNFDRARELYKKALELKPDDLLTLKTAAAFYLRIRQFAAAVPLLDELIAKHPSTPEAAAAQRTKAIVVATSGTQKGVSQALQLLGVDEEDPGDKASTVDDRRTQARILAMQPNRVRRQQAINILQDLQKDKLASGDDLLLMAQLHDVNGNWDDARSTFRMLLEADGQNPRFLASYIRSLLRHDGLAEAQGLLENLERVAPKQPGTVEIQARLLHAQQRDQEAIALLTEFARSDVGRTGRAAELLEELKQFKPAEAMYRTFAEKLEDKRADAVMPLAGFLGRQGRVSEALDLLDAKVWGKLPDTRAANASVMLLYGSKADRTQYDRVQEHLEQAIGRNPNEISIPFDLANLMSLQGRYDEAATIYRKVFERDPTRGVALNNLAWMLCLQGGRDSEAREAIDQAIKLESETPELLDTRAVVELAMGNTAAAIQDLENALVVLPNNAEMYFHLAQAYQKAGRSVEAGEAYRKALDLGLTVDRLHPLEQPRLSALAAELNVNR
jgi:tetratricopeptide (TPR) repeat protein